MLMSCFITVTLSFENLDVIGIQTFLLGCLHIEGLPVSQTAMNTANSFDHSV